MRGLADLSPQGVVRVVQRHGHASLDERNEEWVLARDVSAMIET
jgi:hypothetical protein